MCSEEFVDVIPPGSVAVLKIQDRLAFEWASYYLRNDRVVPIVDSLSYLEKPKNDPMTTKRMLQVRYLVSDLDTDSCWGGPL